MAVTRGVEELEWLRNFIFGDENNEPIVTYIPKMSEVNRHINAVKNEIKSKDETIRILKEALEFYADVESWNLIHPNHDKKDAKTINNSDLVFDTFRSFGGKRAREALKKVEGIINHE